MERTKPSCKLAVAMAHHAKNSMGKLTYEEDGGSAHSVENAKRRRGAKSMTKYFSSWEMVVVTKETNTTSKEGVMHHCPPTV